jgi:hypothetical protein
VWLGSHLNVRGPPTLDFTRRVLDRRAELYVNLLTEMTVEHDVMLGRLSRAEVAQTPRPEGVPPEPEPAVDAEQRADHMGSLERRRLGARVAAFASPKVKTAWGEFRQHWVGPGCWR